MDFDLDLAVQQDSQNPVYYVQYAHARICSLFKKLGVQNLCAADCTDEELALLTAPEELELIRHISAFTNEIIAPRRITTRPASRTTSLCWPTSSTVFTPPAGSAVRRSTWQKHGLRSAPPFGRLSAMFC